MLLRGFAPRGEIVLVEEEKTRVLCAKRDLIMILILKFYCLSIDGVSSLGLEQQGLLTTAERIGRKSGRTHLFGKELVPELRARS